MKRRARSFLHRYIISFFPRRYERSDCSVIVVIPLALKDLGIASMCIDAIKRNLLHPIDEIVIVGQSSAKTAEFCRSNEIKYLDEREILEPDLDKIIMEAGLQSRSGWIKQQFLKLNVASYLDGENFLIIDADTILVRPLAFMESEKQIFWTADDLVFDYHTFTESLIGTVKRKNYSFVAHCMLFQRSVIEKMTEYVQDKTSQNVFDSMVAALLKNKSGYMSEYELYAYFMRREFPDRCVTKYWYNRKAKLGNEAALTRSLKKFRRFNFLSDHNKNR